jgi:hypothetical protein
MTLRAWSRSFFPPCSIFSQVPKGEAESLAQALAETGNKNVELHIIDLNHLMRYHPEEPTIHHRHLDEPVDERVLKIIVE